MLEHSFWEEAWETGKTGFHKDEVNPQLVRYADRLLGDRTQVVLVPLCGRSLDLLWLLERGHRVIGVELVEMAVQGFFDTHGMPFRREPFGPFVHWTSGALEILQGDIFGLADTRLPIRPTAVWDRAAMVALSPSRRAEYAAVLKQTVAPSGASLLLDVFDYDSSEMSGPPFSVPEAEVRNLFSDCDLRLLEVRDGAPDLNRPERPITRFDMCTWFARVPGSTFSPS